MAKKLFGSSAQDRRPGKKGPPIKNSQIDFSDIPELTDEQLIKARRVGRPSTGKAKQLIAIRIAPELLAQLKRIALLEGKPYQSIVHEILEHAVKRRVA